MFAIALVVFREVFEIALIISILAAATKAIKGRGGWIFSGIGLGIVGSCILAYFADMIGSLAKGMGQEIFNATVLISAAILIGWTTIWMNIQGKTISQEFKQLGQAVGAGRKPLYSLCVVIALATLREGAEIVMFIYSAALTGTGFGELFAGAMAGIGLGAGTGVLLYYGLTQISAKKIFKFTSTMLMLLVAGMMAQAVTILISADILPTIIPQLWDTSRIVSNESILGKVLHALFGYTDRSSGMEAGIYVLTLAVLGVMVRTSGAVLKEKPIKAALVLLWVGTSLVLLPGAANAGKKVYSPIVEAGELEFEAQGVYDSDHRPEKNNISEQKYAVGYGVNEHWSTEVGGEIEREKNDEGEDNNYKFTTLSWENIVQLTPQGQWPVDIGVYVEYEASFEDKHPDNIEGKILLEKSLPHFTHTLNITLEQNVGRHPTKDLSGGLAWSSKYRLKEWFQPGIEWHSDFGELGQNTRFSTQEHQTGPVFYGKIGPVKYDVGYLFGVSREAPRGELKWTMEYEMRF